MNYTSLRYTRIHEELLPFTNDVDGGFIGILLIRVVSPDYVIYEELPPLEQIKECISLEEIEFMCFHVGNFIHLVDFVLTDFL